MNPKYEYDKMINRIEELVNNDEEYRADDIRSIVKDEWYKSGSLADVIKFMTDKSLMEYIRERQLVAACISIRNNPKQKNCDLIKYTGHSDEPTFVKAFTKLFGVSPKKATALSANEIPEACTWDSVSKNKQMNFEKQVNTKPNIKEEANTIIGISSFTTKQLSILSELFELKKEYDADDYLVNYIYQIMIKENAEPKDAQYLFGNLFCQYEIEGEEPFSDNFYQENETEIKFAIKFKVDLYSAGDLVETILDEGYENVLDEPFQVIEAFKFNYHDIGHYETPSYYDFRTTYDKLLQLAKQSGFEDKFNFKEQIINKLRRFKYFDICFTIEEVFIELIEDFQHSVFNRNEEEIYSWAYTDFNLDLLYESNYDLMSEYSGISKNDFYAQYDTVETKNLRYSTRKIREYNERARENKWYNNKNFYKGADDSEVY